MLEIVFNESVLGSMEQAAINATHRKPENLFCFPLPLDREAFRKSLRRPANLWPLCLPRPRIRRFASGAAMRPRKNAAYTGWLPSWNPWAGRT